MQITFSALAFLGGLYGFLSATSNNPDFRLMKVFPNVVMLSTIYSFFYYLQWTIDRDIKKGESTFEWHIVLGGMVIFASGLFVFFIMVTFLHHVFF